MTRYILLSTLVPSRSVYVCGFEALAASFEAFPSIHPLPIVLRPRPPPRSNCALRLLRHWRRQVLLEAPWQKNLVSLDGLTFLVLGAGCISTHGGMIFPPEISIRYSK